MITWDDIQSKYKKTIQESFGPAISVDQIILKIIQRRLALGLTQTEVARRAGIKQSAVARLESFSIIPRLDTLIVMLQALNLEINIEPQEKRIKQLDFLKLASSQNKLSKITGIGPFRVPAKPRAPKIPPASMLDSIPRKKRLNAWTNSTVSQEGKVKINAL